MNVNKNAKKLHEHNGSMQFFLFLYSIRSIVLHQHLLHLKHKDMNQPKQLHQQLRP